jgi:group I intron endonuclease
MNHIIYKTTNTLNGRFYIGMHSTQNIDDGYLGSGRRLKAEINKYGKEHFVREVLEILPSRELLKEREKMIVCSLLIADPLCLNLKNGGEGGGKLWSTEHAEKFQAAGTEATKRRHKEIGQPQECLDALARGRKPISRENSCDWNGRTHSEETKAKMRASHLARSQRRISELAITRPS